ncbi:ABC transporter ATP-binding protein/permease [Buchananella hordeovulneris]|uniref:ABC transporter ATP-binding protein/permease n=1 Tax=Buchananella hordeovulneris TaxID=52770 RepID=UPI0026DCCC82|nr:ABC transporter ATP-binding protein/permease [Buchananella hordeovulneris]MDO5080442.1 ATP-binding cassette domain-containing protein [Buchananella hordeovulneris]
MVTLHTVGLGRTYAGPASVVALRDVNITINQGDYVAIQGPSGSGKSTLLNQLALIDTPTSGDYLIDGHSTLDLTDTGRARHRSATFAFIFQSFHLLAGRTVLDNVALGTLYRGLPARTRRTHAQQSLEFVGLAHKADQRVDTLSGGERQRVAIARAIASGAPVVVADEPTGNLDQASGALVMDTLERLHARGATVIIVTHDAAVAERAHRQLHVLDGHVTEAGSPSPTTAATAPTPAGRDSRVRLLDALTDAWRGLTTKIGRTLALIASVALGVGLALTTEGIAQTARFQVSDIFDATRNQRVALTSPSLDNGVSIPHLVSAVSDPEGLQRLGTVAGLEEAAIFVNHGHATITTRPADFNPQPFDVVGFVDAHLPGRLFQVDTAGAALSLSAGDVILGVQAAQTLNLGPLSASPVVWINGLPHRVVGILTDAGLNVSLLQSVIVAEEHAPLLTPTVRYASAEIRVVPGAAASVAHQAPLAWLPTAADQIRVEAPPDPTTLRDQIEANLATMLLTLTGVALLAAVLSLTNAMVTAVYQRTGEFGLRRAIGARRRHIRGLVLTEALVIGVLGGIVGAYLSVLTILAVTIARGWQPVLEPGLIPLGILGGVGVGLLGGLLATRRAARIEPSDALRS